ncbi:angiogenic factor with G patch and FHA domains 1 isoform X3 [Lucilia sericata]|uniref:angiogenic factor with G patch and FHA domains 1 isoform X3 n=1 Tax=Lucilia sericata TaxID=13632 RepID=UPI0018A83170|nr:angiogenic factor with G patch and FHA domains 1 isoform X3 [Lucilia sericata]
MSSSETENTDRDENKPSKAMKLNIKNIQEVKEMQTENLYEYIDDLHALVKKQDKKLKKYKNKINKLTKEIDRLKGSRKDDHFSPDAQRENTAASEDKSKGLPVVINKDNESKEDESDSARDAFSFVDEMRQAAQQAQNISNFIYEPTSGLYYDQKSGYYYNAEYGLYYDGNTGCYYSYNQEKNCYEFHSQVQVQPTASAKKDCNVDDNMFENYVNNSLLNRFSKLYIDRMRKNALDIAKKYPPSLRIVVQETNLDDLKVGNLSLITYKGGSLGREGNHDVIIPDVNVSKFHLKFTYDTKQSTYKCVDLGSRNGTILNGTRMSASKTESESYDLVHGSVIQIAQTKLLCHIHEGNSTCGLCEPGLLIEPQQRDVSSGSTVVLSHKEQLKKIQKKYGLENEKFVDSKQNSTGGNAGAGSSAGCSTKNSKNSYQDRAASRRLKVGSSTDKEKTQTASVDTAISSDNKGFRMLSKLGWNKGEALGKTQESGGLLEPINVESNSGHKGLGCDDPTAGLTLTVADKKKLENMKKTKERYEKADIFSNIYDSS